MKHEDRVYIDGVRVRVHGRGRGIYEAHVGKEFAGRLVLTKANRLESLEILEKWKGKGIEEVLAKTAQRHRGIG